MLKTENVAELGALLQKISSMDGLWRQDEKSPRITEISVTPHEDGVIYDGKIVIGNADKSQQNVIEEVFHQLKHCFKGDYEKVPSWMVEDFRANTAKHSRVSVAYTLTFRKSDGSLTINFHRSMARDASGAHQLRKITAENAGLSYPRTNYRGQKYYAVPLGVKEANRIMGLFASMAADAIEATIFEQEIRKTDTKDVPAKGELTESQMLFGAVAPALGC